MTTNNQNPDIPLFRGWISALLMLVIGVSTLAITIKGYHLFSPDTYEPMLQGVDDASYFAWLHTMVIDGDLDFENNFRESPLMDTSGRETMLAYPRTPNGLLPNKFGLGWALLHLPIYQVVHWLGLAGCWAPDGYGPPYQIAILLVQWTFWIVGLLLSQLIIRRWTDSRIAWISVLGVWLASPLIYYQTARVSMAHNSVYFLSVLILFLALRLVDLLSSSKSLTKEAVLTAPTLGLLAGFLVMVRAPAGAYLLFPVILVLRAILGSPARNKLLPLLATLALAGFLLGITPQLMAWKIIHGEWIVYSHQGESFNWGNPDWWASLLDDHHGLFNWHPLLLPATLGLFWATFRKRFPWAWIPSAIAIVWINAAWHLPAFGSAFGGRAYEFFVFFSMAGMAFLLQSLLRSRFLVPILIVLLSAASWNACFLSLFLNGFVPREASVSWTERVSVFVEVVSGAFTRNPTVEAPTQADPGAP